MSFYITKYEEVEVEIDLEAEITSLSEKDKGKLIAKLCGVSIPFGLGDGDKERINTTIEGAYLAAKQMASVPREIADLFWLVHGRAL